MVLEVLGLVGSTGCVGSRVEVDRDPTSPLVGEVERLSAGGHSVYLRCRLTHFEYDCICHGPSSVIGSIPAYLPMPRTLTYARSRQPFSVKALGQRFETTHWPQIGRFASQIARPCSMSR